jgi:hypothetical protein
MRQKPLALTARGTPAPGGGDVKPLPPPQRTELTEFSLSRNFKPSLTRKKKAYDFVTKTILYFVFVSTVGCVQVSSVKDTCKGGE